MSRNIACHYKKTQWEFRVVKILLYVSAIWLASMWKMKVVIQASLFLVAIYTFYLFKMFKKRKRKWDTSVQALVTLNMNERLSSNMQTDLFTRGLCTAQACFVYWAAWSITLPENCTLMQFGSRTSFFSFFSFSINCTACTLKNMTNNRAALHKDFWFMCSSALCCSFRRSGFVSIIDARFFFFFPSIIDPKKCLFSLYYSQPPHNYLEYNLHMNNVEKHQWKGVIVTLAPCLFKNPSMKTLHMITAATICELLVYATKSCCSVSPQSVLKSSISHFKVTSADSSSVAGWMELIKTKWNQRSCGWISCQHQFPGDTRLWLGCIQVLSGCYQWSYYLCISLTFKHGWAVLKNITDFLCLPLASTDGARRGHQAFCCQSSQTVQLSLITSDFL